MRRPSYFLTAFAALAMVLVPVLADAKPGGNSSSGSRGSRTYSAPPPTQTAPNTARPRVPACRRKRSRSVPSWARLPVVC